MSSTAFDWIQENLSYNAALTEASVAKKAIMAEKKNNNEGWLQKITERRRRLHTAPFLFLTFCYLY